MDEKKPEEFPEEVNPNTRPEGAVPIPEPKPYPMTLDCPNCRQSFNVDTPFGKEFPESKEYTCPTCGFTESARYTICRHCDGNSYKYRLSQFSVSRSHHIDLTVGREEEARR